MGILGWIVFGLIVGALAKLVMPGKDPGGFVVTALLGIVGAVSVASSDGHSACMDRMTPPVS